MLKLRLKVLIRNYRSSSKKNQWSCVIPQNIANIDNNSLTLDSPIGESKLSYILKLTI